MTPLPIIGPRQTTGEPAGSRKPMEMSLTAVALDGVEALLAVGLETGGQAEHGGQVGAGDVGVEQADGGAALGEGDGEVGGDGGLADAALVRGDGDDVADAVDGLGTGGRGRAVLGAVRVGAGRVRGSGPRILLFRPRAVVGGWLHRASAGRHAPVRGNVGGDQPHPLAPSPSEAMERGNRRGDRRGKGTGGRAPTSDATEGRRHGRTVGGGGIGMRCEG